MSKGGSPKRRFPRLAVDHPVHVHTVCGDEQEEFGTARVIGLGGFMFLSEAPLGFRTLVSIEIPLTGGMLRADGRVASERRREDGSYEVGVEFLRVLPADQVRIQALFRVAATPGDSVDPGRVAAG